MEAVYTRCIFCDAELPRPEERGRGEHIIPSHIYGSVRIKDVCDDCNRHFGHSVDVLVLKDARLVNAVFVLDLPDLQARMAEQASTTIEDVDTGQKLTGRFKDGKLRLTPYCKGDIWSIPEDEIVNILGGSLAKSPPPDATATQARDWLAELAAQYKSAKPGTTIRDERLEVGVWKATGKVCHDFETIEGAGKRLAAKVAFEILHYVLPPSWIEAMERDLVRLATYARTGEGEGSSMVFYPCDDDYPNSPNYRHEINIYYPNRMILVDVLLFYAASYRVCLTRPPNEARVYDGRILDVEGLMMTFEPGKPRMKYLAKRIRGESEPRIDLASHL